MNRWWNLQYVITPSVIKPFTPTLVGTIHSTPFRHVYPSLLFPHIDLHMPWHTAQSQSLYRYLSLSRLLPVPSAVWDNYQVYVYYHHHHYSLTAPHPQLPLWLSYHNHIYPHLYLNHHYRYHHISSWNVYCLVSKGSPLLPQSMSVAEEWHVWGLWMNGTGRESYEKWEILTYWSQEYRTNWKLPTPPV